MTFLEDVVLDEYAELLARATIRNLSVYGAGRRAIDRDSQVLQRSPEWRPLWMRKQDGRINDLSMN